MTDPKNVELFQVSAFFLACLTIIPGLKSVRMLLRK